MNPIRIIEYSHFISVHTTEFPAIKIIRTWAFRTCTQWDKQWDHRQRKMKTSLGKRFHLNRLNDTEWHFHINHKDDFYKHLDLCEVKYVISKSGLYRYDKPGYRWSSKFQPRPHQPPVINFIKEAKPVRQVALQTGQGKTFCALYSIAELDIKTMLITKPGYFDRWRDEIVDSLGIAWDEVLYIVGNDELVKAIQMAKNNELNEVKFIVIGFNTLQVYIKDCLESKSHVGKYGIEWHQLFETFNVGIRLIDEVHEWFHFNFMLDLLTNCHKVLSLSATMRPNDPFLERMYRVAYPLEDRYTGEYKRYIHVRSLVYQMSEPWLLKEGKIKTRGPKGYSHIAYESSILKLPRLKQRYFKMIKTIANNYIVDEDGKKVIRFDTGKLIIFVATNLMANALKESLEKDLPGINIYTYLRSTMNKKDKESWEWKPGIIISTLKSAGTAVDIPDLVTTILTHAVDSNQANEQVLGRTRKPTDRDFTPHFIYLSCSDIPSHMNYDRRKEMVFRGKVKAHDRQHIGCGI